MLPIRAQALAISEIATFVARETNGVRTRDEVVDELLQAFWRRASLRHCRRPDPGSSPESASGDKYESTASGPGPCRERQTHSRTVCEQCRRKRHSRPAPLHRAAAPPCPMDGSDA